MRYPLSSTNLINNNTKNQILTKEKQKNFAHDKACYGFNSEIVTSRNMGGCSCSMPRTCPTPGQEHETTFLNSTLLFLTNHGKAHGSC